MAHGVTTASVASSSELSLQEPSASKKPPAKKDKIGGGVNLKKSIVKKTKPKDSEGNGTKAGGNTRSPSPGSPAINGAVQKGGDNSENTVNCKHCKKPVSESLADAHAVICLEKKKERARKKKEAKEAKARAKKAEEKEKEKDGDAVDDVAVTAEGADCTEAQDSTKKPPKKSASKNAADGPKKSKKRKADEGADKEPKKKKLKKDEPPKPKVPKPKGPVNVEQQCGVALPNGGFCARSLTCKSHSMGAKRSVPGRSLPYDTLLSMYQKRNQAKMQKAALDAAAPLLDDEPAAGPVDSDEEKDAVMAAIARSRPTPLEQHIFVPATRKYKQIRMKEMLGNALGVKGSLFGGARASTGGTDQVVGESIMVPTKQGSESVGGDGPSRKSSLVLHQGRAGSVSASGGPTRKASVASVRGT
ncbi:Mitochondrial beta-keto-acyl synthase [Lecanora helva]